MACVEYLVGPNAKMCKGPLRELLRWPESRPGGKVVQWAIWFRETPDDEWDYWGMTDTKREALSVIKRHTSPAPSLPHTQ